MRVADRVMTSSDALQQAATETRELARAEAVAGREAVCSAAMATRGELALEVQAATVMGGVCPSSSRSASPDRRWDAAIRSLAHR
jgi:vacuolar-type H+-ATPase subunit D/Vma8